jgi:2,3-diketo-5-methylthio-1-phosphopentane phosphatase
MQSEGGAAAPDAGRPLAILVDFDGTASPVDVANELLSRFGLVGWERLDSEVARGTRTLRSAIDVQAAMLTGNRNDMLDHVLRRYSVAPSFIGFSRWASSRGHELAVVSDGFGFYVRPLLRLAGLSHLPVLTNQMVRSAGGWRLSHPRAHPRCIGCGTCKMLPVTERQLAGTRVAFVGNGASDRFASYYADVVFAKERLAEFCTVEEIPFLPWETFEDVRRNLERLHDRPPNRESPAVCPGWTTRGGGGEEGPTTVH